MRAKRLDMAGAILLIRSGNLAWDGLRRAIADERRGDLQVVAEVATAAAALALELPVPPDLVLTTAPLPDAPLVPFLAALRERFPQACTIAILDDLATLSAEEVMGLVTSGLAGGLLWEDVRQGTVDHWLATALDGVKVHSGAVLVAVLDAQRRLVAAPPNNLRLHVLLADANRAVRSGLRDLLQEHPAFGAVDQVVDVREIVTVAQRLHPDLIVLDPSTAGRLDTPLIDQLARAVADSRLCVYTAVADLRSFLQAMMSGVSAYVLKGS